MRRCPVLLHLALIFVALFADDVSFIVQLPDTAGTQSTVAIHADSPAPLTAIRLVDAAGAFLEVGRNGRPACSSATKPFAELHIPLNAVCVGMAANFGQTCLASSSLVSQHTRLQL